MGTLRADPAAPQGNADSAVPEEKIRAELNRVVESPAFRGSHRSQDFLRYVVERALAGQPSELKERHIAVHLFGRPADANLAEDTIVRVSAREVRRRLEQYYATAEGTASEVQIHLPAGSYVPEFRPVARGIEAADHPAAGSSADVGPMGGDPQRRTWRRLWWMLAAAVIAASSGGLAWREVGRNPAERASNEFWRPVLSDGAEVLIGVPHPIVFHPSVRATRESAKRQPPLDIPLQRPLALRPEELSGSDFVEVQDQYVAFGDLLAASNLQAMLQSQGKRVRMRLASKIDLADLKESPSIQIGAYTNKWTLELIRNLRFRFDYMPDGRACIVDTANAGRLWALPALTSDGTSEQDYLLITRLVSGGSGQPAVLVAGLKQFGTGAGGQLLADAQRLGEILRATGNDQWPETNLQLVLEMRVIGNTPSPPHLIAWHIW